MEQKKRGIINHFMRNVCHYKTFFILLYNADISVVARKDALILCLCRVKIDTPEQRAMCYKCYVDFTVAEEIHSYFSACKRLVCLLIVVSRCTFNCIKSKHKEQCLW